MSLAASITSAQSYAIPRKVNIESRVRQALPGEIGTKWRPRLYNEQFFPIGWSKDGKLAYYIEPVDEECGCYYARLVIQDLKTDKELWKFDYDQSDSLREGGDTMLPEDNIQKLWKKNQKLFSEKLAEHGIIASQFTLIGKTFTIGGRSYAAKAVLKKGKDADGEGRIAKMSITLSSPKLGTKTLYTEDHSSEPYYYLLNGAVIGALKSPYENRVALVAVRVLRGWEGPPNTGDIKIVGADLTSRFGT